MIILALITLIGTLAIGILSVNRILIMERGSESVLRASIEEDYDENIKNQVDNAIPCWMRCMQAMRMVIIPMRKRKHNEGIHKDTIRDACPAGTGVRLFIS